LEFHEIANLFPLMEGADFDNLVADIKEHGLLVKPIWTLDGKILDGRNRFRACGVAGVEPELRPWKGRGDPIDFVVSCNLKRRQLTTPQRALVAEGIATMRGGGDRRSADQKAHGPSETLGTAAKLMSSRSFAASITRGSAP
jgi:hypothetical protein